VTSAPQDEFQREGRVAPDHVHRASLAPGPRHGVGGDILFERETVRIGARVLWDGTHLRVDMTFEVPEGVTVLLPDTGITARTPDGSTWTGRLSGSVLVGLGQRREVGAGETFSGGPRRLGSYSSYSGVRDQVVWFSTRIAASPFAWIEVTLPPFSLGDRDCSIPPITFVREEHTKAFEPVNT
jgi:hypothetical protein